MKKLRRVTVTLLFAILAMLVPTFSVMAISSSGDAKYRVIDISHWTTDGGGTIDWNTLKSNVDAVYTKATQGITYIDSMAASFAKSAHNAGINIGFYCYFEPDTNVTVSKAQADYFFKTIKSYGYSCVPVVDVEEVNGLNAGQITTSVQDFIDEFTSISGGQEVMIYASQYFANSYLQSSLEKYKFWIANWSSAPKSTVTWNYWTMWQYSDSIVVQGVSVPVDGDWATGNIFLNTPSQLGHLDSPAQTTYYGNINISGWALSRTGIKRIDIYYDNNQWYGSISASGMFTRNDAITAFNQSGCYPNASQSGFSLSIPYTYFTLGTHTIRVAAIGNDGSIQWFNKEFAVAKVQAKNCIDVPAQAADVKGDIFVSGWAVNASQIKRVDMYADLGTDTPIWLGSDNTFTERLDVTNAINGNGDYSYALQNGCDYSLTIKSGMLSASRHTIYVAAIGNDGTVQWSKRQINVGKPVPINFIDSPVQSTKIYGDMTIMGWAVSFFGIKRVDMYADIKTGHIVWLGSVSKLSVRTDVLNTVNSNNQYPDAATNGTGYMLSIKASALTIGTHTIYAAAISRDGSVQWSSKTITIGPSARMAIDTPVVSAAVSSKINISGWAVNHSRINRLDMYADIQTGKPVWLGSVNALCDRQDVTKAINNDSSYTYALQNGCGFSYTADISSLSAGRHTLYVAAIGNDGSVQWASRSIIIKQYD